MPPAANGRVVLITGATGFPGSALVTALRDRNPVDHPHP